MAHYLASRRRSGDRADRREAADTALIVSAAAIDKRENAVSPWTMIMANYPAMSVVAVLIALFSKEATAKRAWRLGAIYA
jgi:hypothetical protein